MPGNRGFFNIAAKSNPKNIQPVTNGHDSMSVVGFGSGIGNGGQNNFGSSIGGGAHHGGVGSGNAGVNRRHGGGVCISTGTEYKKELANIDLIISDVL